MQTSRIAARDALATSSANLHAKYPSRTAERERMEPICSPSLRPSFKIDPGASIFTIGSCFARHIEWFLKSRGYIVPCLGFEMPPDELWKGQHASGVLNKYTPASMLNELLAATGEMPEDQIRGTLVESASGKYLDLQIHAGVPVTLDRGMQRRADLVRLFRSGLEKSSVCILTLGLIETWWDTESGLHINQAPPRDIVDRYPDRFQFEVMSFDAVRADVRRMVDLIRGFGGEKMRVLLTVSPVPLIRTFTDQDVICANMHSKSVLRAVAGEVAAAYDFVDYFPSYESVTLSSRAAAWQDDLHHVTEDLVKFNVNRMMQAYC